jgi:hypothetical protein
MSLDPRVSRFSDDSEQSDQPDQSKLRNLVQSIANLAPHVQPDTPTKPSEQDARAMQSYADYIGAYNEWKDWLAKLSDSEDQLERISLQLEHFASDPMAQHRVLSQWRSERLRWHDLTRLTYIALHKCAFQMTEYHNLLTELYNDTDAESARLARELQAARNTIEELSMRLAVAELDPVQRSSTATQDDGSSNSPVALTDSWANLETGNVSE